MYKFIDGWYELPHNPNNLHKLWAPRLKWCEDTFITGEWYMREVVYDFSNCEGITITPLTWMFKNQEDLLWFLLRWPDILDSDDIDFLSFTMGLC
jgi:hypothetical protein